MDNHSCDMAEDQYDPANCVACAEEYRAFTGRSTSMDNYCPICLDRSLHVANDFSWLDHMQQLQPYRVEYLRKMFDNNVAYWPNRAQWPEMLQYEIIDRNLVTKDSVEHLVLLEMLNESL